ncbi:26961_t:CDS:1, partial [Racocetra persica]
RITLDSRALEFKEDFVKDNDKLMCRFCHYSVDYNIRSTIVSHIESNNHQKNKTAAERTTQTRQQTLPTVLQASESRKNAVTSLVKAFVEANIPLEKVDKLRNWIRENIHEGSA